MDQGILSCNAKDKCDLCEEYNVSQKVQDVSDQLNKKYDTKQG
jgi:hypothetical protein